MGATPNVCFDKIYKLDENDFEACSEAWCEIGIDVAYRCFYVDAIAYFDKAISSNPKNSNAWYHKGLTFLELVLYDDAILCFDESLKLGQNNYSLYNKELVLRRKDEMTHFRETIKDKDIDSLLEIGRAFLEENSRNNASLIKARICFEEMFKLNPDDWRCINLYWLIGQGGYGCSHGKVVFIDELIRFIPDISEVYLIWVEKGEYLEEEG